MDTISCAFGGIDAPGIAGHELAASLAKKQQQLGCVRDQPARMRCLSNIEWDTDALQELMLMP
eukprot:8282428-Karenia_brevis.AAC.1